MDGSGQVAPRRLTTVALSVLWPGLGHVYAGRGPIGVAFGLAQVVLVVVTVFPGAWRVTLPLWVLLVVLAAFDAARLPSRRDTPRRPRDAGT